MKHILALVIAFGVLSCEQKKQEVVQVDELTRLQEALKRAPSFENHINYGLYLAKQGQGVEALQAYHKAAEINPKAPVAWNNICYQLIRENKPMEAVENCKKALSIEPKFQLAQNNLKLAEQKIAEIRNQAEKAKMALVKNPKPESQAVIDTGMTFYSIKEFEKAIEVWKMVHYKDEKFAIAQNNIASSNILLGQFAQAEKALNIALRRDSKNPLFQNNKKWLEQEKQKSQR